MRDSIRDRHAVWSIAIPIAVVELLTPGRRTSPWLGRSGLVVTSVLYLFGCWFIFQAIRDEEGLVARPVQLAGAAIAAALLVVLALAVPRPGTKGNGWVPDPRLLGSATFLLAAAFILRPENWWGVGLGFVLITVAAALGGILSRAMRLDRVARVRPGRGRVAGLLSDRFRAHRTGRAG